MPAADANIANASVFLFSDLIGAIPNVIPIKIPIASAKMGATRFRSVTIFSHLDVSTLSKEAPG
jgi:hypothetical protein